MARRCDQGKSKTLCCCGLFCLIRIIDLDIFNIEQTQAALESGI